MARESLIKDGVVVEKAAAEETVAVEKKASKKAEKKEVEISISDFLKNLGAWLHQAINSTRFKEASGKCVLCGAETNAPERIICYACMGSRGAELIEKSQAAADAGSKTFLA